MKYKCIPRAAEVCWTGRNCSLSSQFTFMWALHKDRPWSNHSRNADKWRDRREHVEQAGALTWFTDTQRRASPCKHSLNDWWVPPSTDEHLIPLFLISWFGQINTHWWKMADASVASGICLQKDYSWLPVQILLHPKVPHRKHLTNLKCQSNKLHCHL